MADKSTTRQVFLGHTDKDQYLLGGQFYGPGVVEVPNEVADQLEAAVVRVNLDRDADKRIDPRKVDTPRAVDVSQATDAELEAVLAERKRQRAADATIGAIRPEDQSGMTAEQLRQHETDQADAVAKSEADRAAEFAKAQADAVKDAKKAGIPSPPPLGTPGTPPSSPAGTGP